MYLRKMWKTASERTDLSLPEKNIEKISLIKN